MRKIGVLLITGMVSAAVLTGCGSDKSVLAENEQLKAKIAQVEKDNQDLKAQLEESKKNGE
jgi:outer membrane murein-binding lipoprotein Lpp